MIYSFQISSLSLCCSCFSRKWKNKFWRIFKQKTITQKKCSVWLRYYIPSLKQYVSQNFYLNYVIHCQPVPQWAIIWITAVIRSLNHFKTKSMNKLLFCDASFQCTSWSILQICLKDSYTNQTDLFAKWVLYHFKWTCQSANLN